MGGCGCWCAGRRCLVAPISVTLKPTNPFFSLAENPGDPPRLRLPVGKRRVCRVVRTQRHRVHWPAVVRHRLHGVEEVRFVCAWWDCAPDSSTCAFLSAFGCVFVGQQCVLLFHFFARGMLTCSGHVVHRGHLRMHAYHWLVVLNCLTASALTLPASPCSNLPSRPHSESKDIMSQSGVPLVPGYHGDDQDPDLIAAEADKIGYPVMLKAVMGARFFFGGVGLGGACASGFGVVVALLSLLSVGQALLRLLAA